MTTEELEQAIRELTAEVARQAARIAELERDNRVYGETLDKHGERLWSLERQARASEDSQRELSAHLNGMTYP
jgi:septal ring factor EnvC (AmiA/AmiB activator)